MTSFAEVPAVVTGLMTLRRGPQDLPYSHSLLVTLAIAAVAIETTLAVRLLDAVDTAVSVARVAASIAVLLGVTFAILRHHQRQARFVQTASSLLIVSLVFGFATTAVLLLALPLPAKGAAMTGPQILAGALSLVLIVWRLFVIGNLFRHALELPLPRGVRYAMLLIVAEVLLAFAMSPVAPAPA